jgi:hypothetical protein
MKRKLGVLGGVLAGSLLLSGQASAAQVTLERFFGGENDCAGYFNPTGTSGFDACTIFVNSNDEQVELSPVISKNNYDDTGTLTSTETNGTLFPSVDGSEFTVTLNGTTNNTGGSWTYSRGADDPGVRYWVSKAGGGGTSGGGFNLYWTVDQLTTINNGVCAGTELYTESCLSEAVLVSSGTFFNPEDKTLSHITFYDTGEVPLPAAVWLFGSGLVALAGIKRRRKSA